MERGLCKLVQGDRQTAATASRELRSLNMRPRRMKPTNRQRSHSQTVWRTDTIIYPHIANRAA